MAAIFWNILSNLFMCKFGVIPVEKQKYKMVLKKILLNGFKSFSWPALLGFH